MYGNDWSAVFYGPGKQAGGVSVLTHAEQHQIERLAVGNDFAISGTRLFRAKFGRYGVNLRGRYCHPLQPQFLRQAGVALRGSGREAAFIAPEDFPGRPVLCRRRQQLIGAPRRAAAGQYDTKNPALPDGQLCRHANQATGFYSNCLGIGQYPRVNWQHQDLPSALPLQPRVCRHSWSAWSKI